MFDHEFMYVIISIITVISINHRCGNTSIKIAVNTMCLQVSCDPCSYERNFLWTQFIVYTQAWKIQDFNGVWNIIWITSESYITSHCVSCHLNAPMPNTKTTVFSIYHWPVWNKSALTCQKAGWIITECIRSPYPGSLSHQGSSTVSLQIRNLINARSHCRCFNDSPSRKKKYDCK